MKQNYYEIYSEIRFLYLNQFQWSPGPYPFVRFRRHEEQLYSLEKWILEAEEKTGKKLRPDARVFLLSNFHLMVLMPLSHPLANGPKDITDAVRNDVQQIVSTAAERSGKESEISGGAVLRATSDLWEKLKINAQNIWT